MKGIPRVGTINFQRNGRSKTLEKGRLTYEVSQSSRSFAPGDEFDPHARGIRLIEILEGGEELADKGVEGNEVAPEPRCLFGEEVLKVGEGRMHLTASLFVIMGERVPSVIKYLICP